MNYLVLETHPAYAVVLDQEGRFLKTANLHYEVGQTVDQVIELHCPPKKPAPPLRLAAAALVLAACLCLFFFGFYRPNFLPYGGLQIQINPSVELWVSQTGRVLSLEGLNPDGEALLEDFRFYGRDSGQVVQELVERAIQQGYLPEGGFVSILAFGGNEDWQVREQGALQAQLENRFGDAVQVYTGPAVSASPAPESSAPPPAASSASAAPASSVSRQEEDRYEDEDDEDNEDDDGDDEDDDEDD